MLASRVSRISLFGLTSSLSTCHSSHLPGSQLHTGTTGQHPLSHPLSLSTLPSQDFWKPPWDSLLDFVHVPCRVLKESTVHQPGLGPRRIGDDSKCSLLLPAGGLILRHILLLHFKASCGNWQLKKLLHWLSPSYTSS